MFLIIHLSTSHDGKRGVCYKQLWRQITYYILTHLALNISHSFYHLYQTTVWFPKHNFRWCDSKILTVFIAICRYDVWYALTKQCRAPQNWITCLASTEIWTDLTRLYHYYLLCGACDCSVVAEALQGAQLNYLGGEWTSQGSETTQKVYLYIERVARYW